MPIKPAPLQFGSPEPGIQYRDRPAVFGIAERDGLLTESLEFARTHLLR